MWLLWHQRTGMPLTRLLLESRLLGIQCPMVLQPRQLSSKRNRVLHKNVVEMHSKWMKTNFSSYLFLTRFERVYGHGHLCAQIAGLPCNLSATVVDKKSPDTGMVYKIKALLSLIIYLLNYSFRHQLAEMQPDNDTALRYLALVEDTGDHASDIYDNSRRIGSW